MARLPKVGNAGVEHQGIAIVKEIVVSPPPRGLGFLFRDRSEFDYGIDGQIEFVDEVGHGAVATGKLISVQIKSGSSYFQPGKKGAWVVKVSEETGRYWRSHSVPVVLILVDVESRAAYWTRADTTKVEEAGATCRVLVPNANVLNSKESRFKLAYLAENTSQKAIAMEMLA